MEDHLKNEPEKMDRETSESKGQLNKITKDNETLNQRIENLNAENKKIKKELEKVRFKKSGTKAQVEAHTEGQESLPYKCKECCKCLFIYDNFSLLSNRYIYSFSIQKLSRALDSHEK